MNTKRVAFGFLILALMSCNFVTQLIVPPTATPLPTATIPPTSTPALPAYIPPQCTSNSLATLAPNIALAQATQQAKINPPILPTTQLQIFQDMTNVIEHVYVYPDYNGKDWSAIKEKYRNKIIAGLDTEVFYQDMQAMITELGDDHSNFLSPIEAKAENAELKGTRTYVGVGIDGITDFDKQSVVVVSTFPGSSADHAGIRPHDSIIQVDGLPITKDLGNRLRGPECSAVLVKVQSPGATPREVMLMRYPVDGSVPIDARLVPTTDGSKIGYIFIPSFFDETLPPQIKGALNQFGKLDGLILDLRLNGGGSSTVVYPIMEFFTEGKLGKFVSRDEVHTLRILPNPIQNSQKVPLIILVGQDTVSFGEIFSGIMQDSGRAKVVGETTLGNVEVLQGYDFTDGSMLWVAAETFHSAFSDVNWEQTGIIPNVQASAPWGTFVFDNDPSIAAAVKLFGHK